MCAFDRDARDAVSELLSGARDRVVPVAWEGRKCESKMRCANQYEGIFGNRRLRLPNIVRDVSLRWGLPSFRRCCDTWRSCHDTHNTCRNTNSQSEKCNFITLWGTFPFAGDFPLVCGAVTHGAAATILTTPAALLTHKKRSSTS